MKTISSIILAVLITNCVFSQDHTDELQKVLDRIDQIGSASYLLEDKTSTPGDTVPFHETQLNETFRTNANDTIVGALFAFTSQENRNLYEYAYDGKFETRMNWEHKTARIDTVDISNTILLPSAPMFIKAKSLVSYSFNNPGQVITDKIEYDDSTKFIFEFPDMYIEFRNLRPFATIKENTVSKYELIVDSNYQPFRLIRKMPHQWSWYSVSNLEYSSIIEPNFRAIQQIPADFAIKEKKQKGFEPKSLIGKKVHDLEFTTTSGVVLNLKDNNEKAMLIQLTGIGCGPCHASIPFLNTLNEKYKNQSFNIIGVEQWNKDLNRIQNYVDKNEINYNYLIPTQETLEFFNSPSVPVFILVNKKGEITDAFIGFGQGNSEEAIISAIEKLL